MTRYRVEVNGISLGEYADEGIARIVAVDAARMAGTLNASEIVFDKLGIGKLSPDMVERAEHEVITPAPDAIFIPSILRRVH